MLQNRVDPWGRLHAVPARGTLMGNRGILHDAHNRIVRQWAHRAWVSCVLCFGDMKRRSPFSPRTYSELFFLDEATAFAAGHRPCMLCRRADARRFAAAWVEGNRTGRQLASIDEMDRILHAERVDPETRTQRTTRASVGPLPDGAMVTLDSGPAVPYLHWDRVLWPWSFQGYGDPLPLERDTPDREVTLLTPPSVVEAFRAGYRPAAHPSCAAAAEHS